MSYADDPKRLARLLRDLAQALEDSGVNPVGASNERHMMDDALAAARELDPPEGQGRSRKFVGF
ncbi:hypothetical protein [Streptomyces rhizosphaerihabitans]|uniref:hypothetical protein n=1 Tax=Streptomyces rhizosphaerihabitans TaxID=1266770 RepID=UPI0021BF5C62|nr:hypothetical protein [Streptomyces rhizosphaerihabitans]MCT9010008.1 hypothetical protein [Streptomyces rhizosphaerihabitans]